MLFLVHRGSTRSSTSTATSDRKSLVVSFYCSRQNVFVVVFGHF